MKFDEELHLFNKDRDVERTCEGLAIDITEAIETGAVGPLGAEMDYNAIDDPKAVLGRVSDNFEVADAERALRSNMNAAKSGGVNSSTPSTPKVGSSE